MENNSEYKIKLKGLNCANCTAKIENKVKQISDVKEASFNFSNEIFTVKTQEIVNYNYIFDNVKNIVNQIEPDVEVLRIDEEKEEQIDYFKIIKGSLVFIGLVVNSMIDYKFKFWVYLLIYIISSYEIYIKALKNIKEGEIFDENFLMVIASLGAFIVGEYPEGIAVMLFYSIGEFFQDLAVDKSRKSITEALNLKPESANIEKNGQVISVHPSDVNLGDIIIVKPGEKIPLDGVVVFGASTIDTSMLSGESLPKFVEVGDEILSGCLNTSSLIKIKVTENYENTTISKIVDMVENASSKKSRTEKTITKFAKVYTPIVVIIAILVAIIAPLLNILDWKDALFRACTFLVISCPCAFVLSVPLGVFAGIGAASKEGIFVKGGNFIEAMENIKNIVFDKTGTLTKGVFEVTDVVSKNFDKNEVLKYAYTAEINSNHPIATAITSYYNGDSLNISNLIDIPGRGIKYEYDGKEILVGNSRLMNEYGIDVKSIDANGILVHVVKDKVYMGCIVVEDTLKENISKDIQELKKQGINLALLSGDSNENVKAVAEQVGVNEFYGELLPIDKVNLFEKILNNSKGKVAFVGDGINDAPVLSRADIGIAMGSIGSDIAIESADVVLMTDEISKISQGIKISKKTNLIIKENITFALAIKFAVLILGLFGFASMWAAVFADVGVSILAIFNSMRALKIK